MTVRVRRRGNGWMCDIRFRWPEDRSLFRERLKAPVTSKSGAQRWGEARETAILAAGKPAFFSAPPDPPSVPTLAEFWPRVLRDHYQANRLKASTVDGAKTIFRVHLAPRLGDRSLDEIKAADVAALKGALAAKKPKTVNNILAVLGRVFRCAREWEVVTAGPRLGFFKVDNPKLRFYERDEYRRLLDGTWNTASRVLVLLAGSAGLRRGEIIALRWAHVDLSRRRVRVQTNVWRGIEGTTKGGRFRDVPLTPELAAALERMKRARTVAAVDGDDLVLPDMTPRKVRNWLARAERRAGLVLGTAREVRDGEGGGIHVLRHTFCSHLAMAGVPAKAIQELAGHADLATTLRYMHLSPGDRDAAVAALARYHGECRTLASVSDGATT